MGEVTILNYWRSEFLGVGRPNPLSVWAGNNMI